MWSLNLSYRNLNAGGIKINLGNLRLVGADFFGRQAQISPTPSPNTTTIFAQSAALLSVSCSVFPCAAYPLPDLSLATQRGMWHYCFKQSMILPKGGSCTRSVVGNLFRIK